MSARFLLLFLIRTHGPIHKTELLKRVTGSLANHRCRSWPTITYFYIRAAIEVRKAFDDMVSCGKVRYTPYSPVWISGTDFLTPYEAQYYGKYSSRIALLAEIYQHGQYAKARQGDIIEYSSDPELLMSGALSPLCQSHDMKCDKCVLYLKDAALRCYTEGSPYDVAARKCRDWRRAENHRTRQQAFRRWQQAERDYVKKLKELL